MSKLQADEGMIFESGKTYTYAQGLSCCFRQWRADSHCKYLHGYSLQVAVTFRSPEVDDRNWVIDFGSLKHLKNWLEETFDHKCLIADDDPKRGDLMAMACIGLIQSTYVEHVGCEAFAKMIFDWVAFNVSPLVDCVEVREHEANFARYRRA